MSELQKRIQKIQRRESGVRLGFGPVSKEQVRAMLLLARVADAEAAAAAKSAGADAIIVTAAGAQAAAAILASVEKKGACTGALVASLDEAGAKALRASGCDFAISTLDGTAAAAVNTDEMGQVVDASGPLDEGTLRALAPLGFDALFVDHSSEMTLGQQLSLVRLASLAATPLLVSVSVAVPVEELRVLRDSGTAGVVAPLGASAEELAGLVERLKAVPAPAKGKKKDDGPLLPSLLGRQGAEHDHDDDDGDDD